MQLKTNKFYLCLLPVVLLPALETISAAENRALKPYTDKPPEISLSKQEQLSLNNHKSIFKTISTQNGEQLVIVFKVDATPEKIWSTIKNYSQYKNWIKNVKESEIYKTEENNIYVRFRIKHWALGKYQYFVNHTFSKPKGNWATWTLDENKQSDFLSSVGFWSVYKIENKYEQSYVFYSADILFKKKKSKFIQTRAIKSSLKQASNWLKIQSEKSIEKKTIIFLTTHL